MRATLMASVAAALRMRFEQKNPFLLSALYQLQRSFVFAVTLLSLTTRTQSQVLSPGSVVAWGGNLKGQTNVPVNLGFVVAIAAGGTHTVALKADGNVVAWGNSADRRTNTPPNLSGVTAIAAGFSHTEIGRAHV